MTTLELLNEIEKAPAFMGGSERYKSVAGSDILYEQDIERIRKDLEVLEILKKYYVSDGWSNGGTIEFWEMSEKQLDKIAEWLEK